MSTPTSGLEQPARLGDGQPYQPPAAGFFAKYILSHPTGFWFFFWGEFAERSCYYGMRAILVRYLAEQLGLGDAIATAGYSYFIAACYFLPLIGGYLADNFFGKYWTIVGFSIPYIVGQFLLTIQSIPFMIVALALLAMGSGVIKPNISTLMGMTYDQYRPGQDKLRSDAFAMFYGAINIGAAMSSGVVPVLRDNFGYSVAFLFPAALMIFALFTFALGKKHYAVEVVQRTEKSPDERAQQWATLQRLGGLFLVVTFFWTVFDQSGSTWTLFARDYMDLNLMGMRLAPDQLQTLNPVFIVVLLPGVTIFWHLLSGWGINLRPTDKMVIGFILTALTMGIMAWAGYLTSAEQKVSMGWQAIAFVLLTIGEICISVVGLELAFTAAPKSMKGFVTGCWLANVFVGNLIAAQIAPLYTKMHPGNYFAMNAGLLVVITLVFVMVARRFNRQLALEAGANT